MMRLLAFLGDSVVIVSNESTVCRFNQIVRESPVRGYYDGCFNYSFVRRTQFRKGDSIRQIESRGFPFSCLVGISVEADGEVVSHVHTEGEDSNGFELTEQIADYQGNIQGLTNSWYGGDNYSVNALSVVWEQYQKLDPKTIFAILEPTVASSVTITIATIKKNVLLKSIEMINSGMSYSDVEKLWTIEKHTKPIELKSFGIDDVQEFNPHNLSQLTAYHTLPDQKTE